MTNFSRNAAQVTVCIPVYQPGRFLTRTLKSLQRQTFTAFIVKIGIEPPWSCALDYVRPFLQDSRISLVLNRERLGWDGNVHSLLASVDTPFFFILPHDDFIHPVFLERLMEALATNPSASGAYCDMQVFGSGKPFRKSVKIRRSAEIPEQILDFFLAGGEAVPWRSVTRSSVIQPSGGFPVDGHLGFAVECEWALELITRGGVVHLPERLFFKQLYPEGVVTASMERLTSVSQAERAKAWERHRCEIFKKIERVISPDHKLYNKIVKAAWAVMLRRYRHYVGPMDSPVLQAKAMEIRNNLHSAEYSDIIYKQKVEQFLTESLGA